MVRASVRIDHARARRAARLAVSPGTRKHAGRSFGQQSRPPYGCGKNPGAGSALRPRWNRDFRCPPRQPGSTGRFTRKGVRPDRAPPSQPQPGNIGSENIRLGTLRSGIIWPGIIWPGTFWPVELPPEKIRSRQRGPQCLRPKSGAVAQPAHQMFVGSDCVHHLCPVAAETSDPHGQVPAGRIRNFAPESGSCPPAEPRSRSSGAPRARQSRARRGHRHISRWRGT